MSVSTASAPIHNAKAQAMQIPTRIKNPTTGAYIPLSSTPGGSLYGTTPGGTRIVYDRSALMNYKNSPLSKSPAMLPAAIINLGITNGTAHAIPESIPERKQGSSSSSTAANPSGGAGAKDDGNENVFEME